MVIYHYIEKNAIIMYQNLKKYNILLASKSPRRRELLSGLFIPYQCINISGIEETYPNDMKAEEVPMYLANLKADAYLDNMNDNDMIITADTLVILNGEIMGKPHSAKEAVQMLMHLSGKTHHVVTGVCINTKYKRVCFSDTSYVTFDTISEDEAKYYVGKFSPLDKAGAYGVQEWIGYVAVKDIQGSFYNVMGLPTHKLFRELAAF